MKFYFVTADSKQVNNPSYDESHLQLKVQANGLQRTECFKDSSDRKQALICDVITPVRESTNAFHNNPLPRKTESDGM